MSGSHYAAEPRADGRYTLKDTLYELPAAQPGRRAHLAAPEPEPDCTVWTKRVEMRLDALEADAGLRLDNLVDVAERLAQRIARLEAENKALREAVSRHADLLQHYCLMAGI